MCYILLQSIFYTNFQHAFTLINTINTVKKSLYSKADAYSDTTKKYSYLKKKKKLEIINQRIGIC